MKVNYYGVTLDVPDNIKYIAYDDFSDDAEIWMFKHLPKWNSFLKEWFPTVEDDGQIFWQPEGLKPNVTSEKSLMEVSANMFYTVNLHTTGEVLYEGSLEACEAFINEWDRHDEVFIKLVRL